MSYVRIFVVLSFIAILIVACGNKSDNEYNYQTINEVDSMHTTLVYDNDFARVVKLELHTKESIPIHNTEPRLVYILNDYEITLKADDQETVLKRMKGEIHWHASQAHAWTNTGNSIANCLIISRTENMLPDYTVADLEKDVAHVEHVNSELLFENDVTRTVKVTLAPGEEIPAHEGINRLMIALTDFDVELTTSDNVTLPLTLKTEETRWFIPGTHSLKNIGETTAEYLIISFKK